MSAAAEGLANAGAAPAPPAEFPEALAFMSQLRQFGADPGLAYGLTLIAFPEVNDFANSLAQWIQVYSAPVQTVLINYHGLLH